MLSLSKTFLSSLFPFVLELCNCISQRTVRAKCIFADYNEKPLLAVPLALSRGVQDDRQWGQRGGPGEKGYLYLSLWVIFWMLSNHLLITHNFASWVNTQWKLVLIVHGVATEKRRMLKKSATFPHGATRRKRRPPTPLRANSRPPTCSLRFDRWEERRRRHWRI